MFCPVRGAPRVAVVSGMVPVTASEVEPVRRGRRMGVTSGGSTRMEAKWSRISVPAQPRPTPPSREMPEGQRAGLARAYLAHDSADSVDPPRLHTGRTLEAVLELPLGVSASQAHFRPTGAETGLHQMATLRSERSC